MKKKILLAGILSLALVLGMTLVGCSSSSDDDGAITYEAETRESGGTTNRIKITFNGTVTELALADITVTNGTGAATPRYDNSAIQPYQRDANDIAENVWNIDVTTTAGGTVTMKITKAGIDSSNHVITLEGP